MGKPSMGSSLSFSSAHLTARRPESRGRRILSRSVISASQDIRGRYASKWHRWRYRHDGPDGHDRVKWIGAQAWSNGKTGTGGTSYPGGTAACTRPFESAVSHCNERRKFCGGGIPTDFYEDS